MISAIITLLTALSLAAVAGWFSIIGFTTIYAGAVIAAVIMGAVTECAKVVTTSWLYRNWSYAGWLIKAPLIFFTVILMGITSLGVFGFLSKAHLDQGASTVNNSAKIEQLNYQISREQSLIADAEKVIAQLDTTVNSLIERNRADRSIAVRRSQESTRKQLRKDIADAQQRIDALNKEKFTYESEIRNLELEIGPIKYIAELIYGDQAADKNTTKAAVQLFTLMIVITLDPLAVVLLIAANQSIVRLQKEKKKALVQAAAPVATVAVTTEVPPVYNSVDTTVVPESKEPEPDKIKSEDVAVSEDLSVKDDSVEVVEQPAAESENLQAVLEQTKTVKEEIVTEIEDSLSNFRNTTPGERPTPWATQEEVLRELMGSNSIPIKTDIPSKNTEMSFDITLRNQSPGAKYPKVKSWLKEFTGDKDGRK